MLANPNEKYVAKPQVPSHWETTCHDSYMFLNEKLSLKDVETIEKVVERIKNKQKE